MKIYDVEIEDLNQIAEIEKYAFSQPRSLKALLEEFYIPQVKYFVARKNSIILGYVGMRCVCDEIYISNIATNKNYLHRGIAGKLLTAVLKFAANNEYSTIVLDVRKSNVAAQGLYEKFNFKKAGIRRNFYQFPTEDAFVYIIMI